MNREAEELRSKRLEEALAWTDRVVGRLFELCDEFGIRRPQGNDAAGLFMLALMLASVSLA